MINIPIEKLNNRWDKLPDNLREFIYASDNEIQLDEISKKVEFNDGQRFDLGLLLDYIIYGFISTQEIFESIKSNLGVDSKKAIDIFHGFEKIIEPLKVEVDENYQKYKIESSEFREIQETVLGPKQVILKQNPSSVVDLKQEEYITKTKISSEPAPFVFSNLNNQAPQPVSSNIKSAPVQIQNFSYQQDSKPALPPHPQIDNSPLKSAPQNTNPTPNQIPDGPVILHRVEEAQGIAPIHSSGAYKQATFGGSFGSFKSSAVSKPAPFVSRAKVTVSSSEQQVSEEKNIPLKVKSFGSQGQPVKVVNYNPFMTPLKKSDGQPKDDGKIDLNNMTFSK